MITYKELNPENDKSNEMTEVNLQVLLLRINVVRREYGKLMRVTSGLRSMEKHLKIYEEKNAVLKAKGLPEIKVPMASKHLYGQAVDIADYDGSLKKWCLDNVALLESIGLWMEDFAYTAEWVHFQIVSPKSGKRFFIP